MIDTFSRRGVALISAAESLDTSSAGGRLVVNVLGAVAQWEREATAERTSAALQVLKQQGRATGGVAPYGYQFIDGRRAWHQGEQETHAAIIEHRAAGLRQAERHRGGLLDAGRGGALSAAGQERARVWRVATLHTYQGGRRPADNGAQVGKAQVGVG